jgi:hypothetical protein
VKANNQERMRQVGDGGVTRTEKLVYFLSRRSFLSLWSYANPRGRNNKELCDILVVCEPDILIISVKEVEFTGVADSVVDQERWQRRAVNDSCKQIYGAERWLEEATDVIRSDGAAGLPLPQNPRRIHRIAVALGGKGRTLLRSADFGRGFIHVFDERSLIAAFGELDTVSDFFAYLRAKEELLREGVRVRMVGTEEDLLALYLHGGRSFPRQYNVIVVDRNLWRGLRSRKEWKARKDAEKESYHWDSLIERLTRDISTGHLEFGATIVEAEVALRTMVKEDRFSRRLLAESMHEFAKKKVHGARVVRSPSGVVYVFFFMPLGTERRFRSGDLENRCFVARGMSPDAREVIGIATETYDPNNGGSSFDLIYFKKDVWEAEDQALAKEMKDKLGYFREPTFTHQHEDEYPGTGSTLDKRKPSE